MSKSLVIKPSKEVVIAALVFSIATALALTQLVIPLFPGESGKTLGFVSAIIAIGCFYFLIVSWADVYKKYCEQQSLD